MRTQPIVAALAAVPLAVLSTTAQPWVTRTSKVPNAVACPVNAKKANLDFTLKDMDGKDVKLTDYKSKVLLVNFWATWCGPCKVEIPTFVDLYSKYKSQGFEIVGILVDDPIAKAKPFAQQYKMNYPVLNGNGRDDLEDTFGPLWGLPTSFIIGRDGKMCRKHVGLPPSKSLNDPHEKVVRDTFEAEIQSLLRVVYVEEPS
jgi:peroxiredoxin